MDEKSNQSDVEGNPDSNMNLSMTPSADDILRVSPVNSFDKTVPQSTPESKVNSFDKNVAQTTTESRFNSFHVAQMPPEQREAPVNTFDKNVGQSAPVVQSTAERVATRRAARRRVRKPPMSPTPVTTSQSRQLSQDNTLSPSRFRTTFTSTEEPMTPSRRSSLSEEAFSSSSEDDDQSETNVRESIAASLASRRSARLPKGDGLSPSVQSEFDKAVMTGDGVPNVGSASFDKPKEAEFLSQAETSVIQEAMSMDDSHEDSPGRSNTRARRLPRTQRPTSPASAALLPPPPPIRNSMSWASRGSDGTGGSAINSLTSSSHPRPARQELPEEDLSAGVLPDVLMNMRQKIESFSLFDSDMMRLAQGDFQEDDLILQETRETLKRSSQQSISPAVLVSLAHKRYERRRLAAMEIEKVIRGLVHQGELERVRAILLLLSDDYVRSTSEDARKGGVVGLAACAIGLKKASDDNAEVMECRDLILASVVHACQDHSQRVRYYATESLFNVVKIIPSLAVAHFFVLFEILRSLYADVDPDVRSGAEFLDKKLKDVIVGAINSGSFTADACVPIFARFVYMRNKATKRLTLTWLQELNEKLIGSPVLEFLHLFLSGIFAMVADPNVSIRQSALAFLQSVLPKLLVDNAAFDDKGASMMKVDFDKILQSLVTTMEHPDPFVRKVAMFWMSRVVKAHMSDPSERNESIETDGREKRPTAPPRLSAASMSVRNSLPHMLPGVLLSIGDTFHSRTSTKDAFLPDLTTRSLAEQTNSYLQNAVRRDGEAYVSHLDGFIVALREELDSPGGMNARNPPAIERKPYRMDVTPDGTGIESPGWFRASVDEREDESTMMSRLCALEWVVVLYESVVPDALKAEYAREFITPIIHQLVDNPPEGIIFKSLEVLANITVPVDGEKVAQKSSVNSLLGIAAETAGGADETDKESPQNPMTDANVLFALDVLDSSRRQSESRDRQVFTVLIRLHAHNHQLVADLSRVIQFMCTLQAPEFVFVSFAVELDHYVRKQTQYHVDARHGSKSIRNNESKRQRSHDLSGDFEFVSSFVQQMNHVLLNTEETKELRKLLKDCVSSKQEDESDRRKKQLFHILLHSFSHNLAATLSLCLWGGAYRTASTFLRHIDPLDINLIFLVEVDKLVEMLERPLFRHLQVRMLECDSNPGSEGSGNMLFRTLKSLLMLVPQSTCYRILRDRLVSISRFRQSALAEASVKDEDTLKKVSESFVSRVVQVRKLHCDARWEAIRADSLETAERDDYNEVFDEGESRREWLGYSTKKEEDAARARYQAEKRRLSAEMSIEEIKNDYHDLNSLKKTDVKRFLPNSSSSREQGDDGFKAQNQSATDPEIEAQPSDESQWKEYWEQADAEQ